MLSYLSISFGAEYDLKTITATMEASCKKLDNVKLTYTDQTFVMDEAGNREIVKGTFAQNLSEGYVLLDERSQTGETWKPDKETTGIARSFNGQVTRYLEHEKNRNGHFQAALFKDNHNPKLYLTRNNPYYRLWRINYKTKLTDLMNDPNGMTKIVGEEFVHGLKTVKINFKAAEGLIDYNLWVLPEKNYSPIQLISYHKHYEEGKQTYWEMHWNQFKELTSGLWCPMNIKLYNRGHKEPTTLTIETIDLSPLTAEDFHFDFPPLTHVTDELIGRSYLITEAPKEPLVGIGKPLPDLNPLNLSLAQTENKPILVCFFDMQQRPSRNCMIQLAKLEQSLQQKGVAIRTVQALPIDENTLNQWTKENKISFPVGMVHDNETKTKADWGIQSLPWLILTDKEHKVVAEGFELQALNDKLTYD